MLSKFDAEKLIEEALKARKNAYAPYSGFYVGAALLAKDGKVYHGCNVENASFGVTNCAERSALFTAIAGGVREFVAIAVVGGKAGEEAMGATPCGICRQALSEFCEADFQVILKSKDGYESVALGALLPYAFSLKGKSR